MVQWKQIAQREGWKDVVRLPEVKFSETILDPVHALALLLFAGKSLWLKPSHGELIRLTYEKPYFIITVWKEGSAHVEVSMTPDFLTVASLLSKNAAFLQ